MLSTFHSLILLFLFPPTAVAGSLAQKVQETYQNTASFRADFVQKTFIEILEREVEEKGEMVFSRPGRFRIHYQGARERIYISDGKTLWVRRPRDAEVEVHENVGDLVSQEALVFLGGLGEMSREFRVTETGLGELTLVPRKKKSLFSRLVLQIDRESHLVTGAILFPRSGNRSHYRFSGIRLNEPAPESLFK